MEDRVLTEGRIEAYGAALRREERAAATVQKYLHDVQTFSAWLGGRLVDKEATAAWKASLLG